MKNKAIEFVKESLEQFVIQFPQINLKYEYDDEANVHCVEIHPKEAYSYNEEYIRWENKFTNIFIRKFPDQNICFVSEDSLLTVSNPVYEHISEAELILD